ncbi:MAG: DNA primase [Minisyncoccia bacterium]
MATPVEQIKERLSIIDVVGGYVELKHAGKHFKGKSPFTNEKTPSFYVSPDRGMYYCFSSQKGGDMFTFIQEMEGVDFKGALKILAERANVELVAEDPKKRDARETQYALLEEATKYFFNEREAHPNIQKYIEDRGVKAQSVHTWRIGYAKDEWRAVRKHLTEKGFTDEQMLAAGLIKKADQGKEPYDVFRDRIMFPLFDPSGRVVAFSGRTLKSETGIPKYVNSPETELFKKSEIMYGYDKAKQGIRQYEFSLVVEGQFDLVLSHQAGYTNTVAVSGTALTSHHIMLLLRLSPKVVLALDADRAGISAVKRSSLPMLKQGMDVKVAHMPDGMDPADIVRKDPHELKHIVGGALHVVEFLLSILKENTKDERTYKLRVREEILPLLVAIDNRIDREHFEGVIAEHIGATKEGIHYEVERLGEIQGNTPGAAIEEGKEAVYESKGVPRKQALESHLRALVSILNGDYEWIGKKIVNHLTLILDTPELEAFMKLTPAHHGEEFALEEQISNTKERQILEEIGDTLTLYSHLVARERLSKLRTLLKLAEAEKNDDQMLIILAMTKEAEKLLQKTIVIAKDTEI